MTLRGGLAALATSVVMASHANLGAQTADRGLATPIEQALIEYACAAPAADAPDAGGHDECLHARLDALRADFGRDLSRLSSGDRHAIDSACAPIRAVQGREGYVKCLASQLAVFRNRASRAHPVAADAPPAVDSQPAQAQSQSQPAVPRNARASMMSLLVGIAAVVAVGCSALLLWRSRRLRRACRVCGARIGNEGDLCAACRHQAAEALRRTAAERVELQRAQENEARRQREHDEEERRRLAREAEETRLRQLELARRREEEEAEEARRRDAEDAAERERQAAADAASTAFDPHAVLGVPRDATIDAVRAAYDQARSKYDPEQVAGLGLEVREHYIAKAQAAERAYEMLVQSLSVPAEPGPLRDQARPEPRHEPAPPLDPHQASAPLEASS